VVYAAKGIIQSSTTACSERDDSILNKYVRPPNTQTEIYASRFACCPW